MSVADELQGRLAGKAVAGRVKWAPGVQMYSSGCEPIYIYKKTVIPVSWELWQKTTIYERRDMEIVPPPRPPPPFLVG